MGWLSKLFGLSPYELTQAPPPRAKPPKRRGLTEEERKVEAERYNKQIRESAIYASNQTREKAEFIGATKYVWRTAGDSDVCAACATNNGKRFSWSKPPKTGAPGEHECEGGKWCRCCAEPIIK
jgi:uncharacterized protein with gpF-like domain